MVSSEKITPDRIPGKECVWDYPRPPKLEKVSKRLRVFAEGEMIADTTEGYRVLETSHPPTYYFPPKDVQLKYFKKTSKNTFCEWKGAASYYTIQVKEKILENKAWYYPDPNKEFLEIKDYISFYPSFMDKCLVDEEVVQSQEGDFYGGWITSNITGPFKGGVGTYGW